MRYAILGGDKLPFGEDDVIDFLAQYGPVRKSTLAKGTVYLSRENPDVVLQVYPVNACWVANLYINGHLQVDGDDDLQKMVFLFLEAVACP